MITEQEVTKIRPGMNCDGWRVDIEDILKDFFANAESSISKNFSESQRKKRYETGYRRPIAT